MDTRDRERTMLACVPMAITGIALLIARVESVDYPRRGDGDHRRAEWTIDIALFTLRQRRTDPTGQAERLRFHGIQYAGTPVGAAVAASWRRGPSITPFSLA
jgi:hypothetical protein